MGIDFIKEMEGFRGTPYQDEGGVWTIGFGHTKGVTEQSDPISGSQAETLLRQDIAEAVKTVDRLVKIALNQNQSTALVDFCFNEGSERFLNSTLLERVNAGDFRGAFKEFSRWVYYHKRSADGSEASATVSQALVKRRAAEAALFVTPA